MHPSRPTSAAYIQPPGTGFPSAALGIGPTSKAYPPLSGTGATPVTYTQQSGTRPPPTAYTAPIFQNSLSASHPPAVMITTSIGYGREISNLAKIYTDDAKYSGHNNSFTFKLAIFHDILSGADVSPEAKMKAFSTMLKGPTLANYSSNIDISSTVMNSNQVRYSIRRK